MRNIPWLAIAGIILFAVGYHTAGLILVGLDVVIFAIVVILALVVGPDHRPNRRR